MSKRLFYLDSLKVIAIFAVVLIHSASMPLYTNAPDSALFAYANLLDSLSRFCVPLFFMANEASDVDIFYERDSGFEFFAGGG